MPCIIVEKGPERGASVEINAGDRLIFGRDESCDFVTNDISCSRRHFGIGERDGKILIKDLGSTHGTLLNGRRVERAELRDGDTIVAGESTISFSLEAPGASRGLVGKSIAGYQVIERIGRGGMGTVYRAKQIALDREVALKVLSHRYSDDKVFINRFFKEAQAAARLNNPNVVQVYDVREEKGLYLISLEMMDNGTIQDLATREGQLPISRVLSIARDATRGLVYAEKKGIVHGDIKPDNLMSNSEGVVKISDLGLARDAGEVAHQGEEGIFGTPHFISPEQAQGKAVDSRSDIYSLGATLYRLIAGVTPFSGNDVREIVMKQINEAPKDLLELRPDCPRDLGDLVAVMMAKDSTERFDTAEELLGALESLGTSGSLSRSSSNKLALIAFLAVVVLGGGAGWYFLAGPGKAQPAPVDDGGSRRGIDENNGAADADAARRLAALRARELLTEADRFDITLAREERDTDVAALDDLKARYQAAYEAAPESEAGLEAADKALAVNERIKNVERRAEEAKQRRSAAEEKLTAATAAVERSLENGSYAEALAAALAGIADLGEEYADLTGLAADLRDRVDSAAAAARDVAMNACTKRLETNDFAGAREALAPLVGAYAEGAEGPPYEAILAVRAAARTRLAEIDRREREHRQAAEAAARAADDIAVNATLSEHYRALAAGFDIDVLLGKLEALVSGLKTDRYTTLVTDVRERAERIAALREGLRERVAAGEEFAVAAGSRVLPKGNVHEVKADVLVIERRGEKKSVAWTDLDPATLLKVLWSRFPRNAREKLDVAVFCLETGLLQESAELLEELEEGEELSAELASFRTAHEREERASNRLDRINRLYAGARNGQSDSWFQLKREIDAFFRNFVGTRSFILASNGETPLVP